MFKDHYHTLVQRVPWSSEHAPLMSARFAFSLFDLLQCRSLFWPCSVETFSYSFFFPILLQELRSSSRLIHEFCDESSIMNTDGFLCTMWLKNLKKPIGSLMFSQENESRRNLDTFQFCAQPNSVAGSVVQLLGISALVRATAWEIYGRWFLIMILLWTLCSICVQFAYALICLETFP